MKRFVSLYWETDGIFESDVTCENTYYYVDHPRYGHHISVPLSSLHKTRRKAIEVAEKKRQKALSILRDDIKWKQKIVDDLTNIILD